MTPGGETMDINRNDTALKDATASPRHPALANGYQSALVNFGFIASGVLTTDEVVKAMG
jgi:hypothetical protein